MKISRIALCVGGLALIGGCAASTDADDDVNVAATLNSLDPANAGKSHGKIRCSTRQASDAEIAAEEARITASSGQAVAAKTISVYVHVITSAAGAGGVSGQQISDQIGVLNAARGRGQRAADQRPDRRAQCGLRERRLCVCGRLDRYRRQ